MIIIASGTDGKQRRWGHYHAGSWVTGSQARPEIMISGEGLHRDAASVLGTLLHEAAHALAAARGIKDTSRQGRYHNKHYKALAEELGITVEFDKTGRLVGHHRPRPHRRRLCQPAPGARRRHDAVAAG